MDACTIVAIIFRRKALGKKKACVYFILVLLGNAMLQNQRAESVRGRYGDNIGTWQLHCCHSRGKVGGEDGFVCEDMLLCHEEIDSEVSKRQRRGGVSLTAVQQLERGVPGLRR
jgi:hypothetical protein